MDISGTSEDASEAQNLISQEKLEIDIKDHHREPVERVLMLAERASKVHRSASFLPLDEW